MAVVLWTSFQSAEFVTAQEVDRGPCERSNDTVAMPECDGGRRAGQQCCGESAGRNIVDHRDAMSGRFAAARDRGAHSVDRGAQAPAVFGQRRPLPWIKRKADPNKSSIPRPGQHSIGVAQVIDLMVRAAQLIVLAKSSARLPAMR